MKCLRLACTLACALVTTTFLTPTMAADMTHERALAVAKEPHNWLLHHGNYEGHRFSQLKAINTDNVKDLKMVFSVALGGFESGGRYKFGNLEGTPLVEDGVMYVTDGWGSVYAIDVSSGKRGQIRWKFDPGVDRAWAGDVACCGVNNRGVALWKDKIVSIGLDGRIFLISKATGELIWERKVGEPAIGETITAAPLVVNDIAVTGAAGGEFGIRGWYDATDLNTGKQAWRTFTIPGKGEPGNETWKDGKDRWMHGGASALVAAMAGARNFNYAPSTRCTAPVSKSFRPITTRCSVIAASEQLHPGAFDIVLRNPNDARWLSLKCIDPESSCDGITVTSVEALPNNGLAVAANHGDLTLKLEGRTVSDQQAVELWLARAPAFDQALTKKVTAVAPKCPTGYKKK